ncbi:hypothetical protein B296_00008506 [Ensete ventricosum]|uniref:Uncharacterized protein n=1 Tax=Ensete ventricosum TaxID=4639 RepID=A0A427B5V6_ENSVE|nr:hypothetical protein B296_00008506 [Ensete ventricosum]
MKKKGMGSEARAELMAKADADLELLNHAEQERQLQKQKKRRNQGREEDVCAHTLAKLERFKKTLSTKLSAPSSNGCKDNNEEDDSGWMVTQLKFIPESSEKYSKLVPAIFRPPAAPLPRPALSIDPLSRHLRPGRQQGPGTRSEESHRYYAPLLSPVTTSGYPPLVTLI